MSIPDFNSYGLLPEGIYTATIDEIEEKFCNIGDTKKRKNLFHTFKHYLEGLKAHNVKYDLYIDGSFVTKKCSPGDIDILLFYDWKYNNRDWEYLLSDDIIKIKFNGLQVLPAFLGTESEELTIEFAMSHFDEYTNEEMKKGIVKVII